MGEKIVDSIGQDVVVGDVLWVPGRTADPFVYVLGFNTTFGWAFDAFGFFGRSVHPSKAIRCPRPGEQVPEFDGWREMCLALMRWDAVARMPFSAVIGMVELQKETPPEVEQPTVPDPSVGSAFVTDKTPQVKTRTECHIRGGCASCEVSSEEPMKAPAEQILVGWDRHGNQIYWYGESVLALPMGAKPNPDWMKKRTHEAVAEPQYDLDDPMRGTGRTIALVLQAIATALLVPDTWVPFRDHSGRTSERDPDMWCDIVGHYAHRIDVQLEIERDGIGCRVKSPIKRIRADAESKKAV